MCGRFAYAPKLDNKEEDIQIIDRDNTIKISYNFSPGMTINTINSNSEVVDKIWGLIPHWAKDLSIGSKLYNARSETAHEKPSFRNAFNNRCLIPISGFYEWKSQNRKKQPYYIKSVNDKTLFIAGICDFVKIEETEYNTVTILTTEPNPLVKSIHNRMPVVIGKDSLDFWFDADIDSILKSNIFTPYSSNDLEAYRVSDQINHTNIDSEKLIENIDITLF